MEKDVDTSVQQLADNADVLDKNAGVKAPGSKHHKSRIPKRTHKLFNNPKDTKDAVQAKNKKTEKEKLREKAEKEAMKEQARVQKEAEKVGKSKQEAEKQALKEQTRALKELNRQEKEKEKAEKEAKKEQARVQKEAKEKEKVEKEAKKEQARLQKETLRQEKELKRQQEEAEKEQKRREKEAAERKKQTDLQKQATIMDRFLQSQKEKADALQTQKHVEHSSQPSVLLKENEERRSSQLFVTIAGLATLSMDQELNANKEYSTVELLRNHVLAWKAWHSSEKVWRWGIRRYPKAVVYKELRLQGTSADTCNGTTLSPTLKHVGSSPASQVCKRLHSQMNGTQDVNLENLDVDWESGLTMQAGSSLEDIKSYAYKDTGSTNKHRKLLQFDKSHRPAYYGTFSKKSETIGPRRPFDKDASLDYEIDSDEEWEEDDPGESLSDCDKDEDDEKLDVEEDEAADGFVVPDGYLSENEGVQVEEFEAEHNCQKQTEASSCENPFYGDTDAEQQTHSKLQSILSTMTEHALRSNRPYIISNFSNNGCSEGTGQIFSLSKTEELCLEALKMQTLIPGVYVELLEDWKEEMNSPSALESSRSRKGGNQLPDSALPEMVKFLLSCSQGMKKTVDSLSKIFPGVTKSELENKVREISEFVGNHWQVKKEVMEKMGINTPHIATAMTGTKKNSPPQLRPITKFFSKRCLPLEEAAIPMQSHEEQSPKKPNLDAMQSHEEQGQKKPKLDPMQSHEERGPKTPKLES
ncbi:hypothetical protein O6H91_11G071700 [Diphasiastrum complanatum]|uniref:Uncharacterized protein n=1 Tax=Diphasiastrum complanatum TaxID=34168 RepID=A0ACC2CAN8_DIPCM|nr:hypothetical protein O6H91_11G071700 [Diphasiastrum complanatum]